jgi:hypothetical protein
MHLHPRSFPVPEKERHALHSGRLLATAIASLALAAGATTLQSRSAAAAEAAEHGAMASCNRACLDGFVDRYLEAAAANDPQRLPVTTDVKYTEDGQQLRLGDGLWNTATGVGTYKHYMEDVAAGEVACFCTMREAGAPVILALRLKVVGRKVAEIETIVNRTPEDAKNLEKRGAPDPLFSETLPPAERASRADLVNVANLYFSGMQLNTGKDYYPFTDDCDRWENGTEETNNHGTTHYNPIGAQNNGVDVAPGHRSDETYSAEWSCKRQFESGTLHFVTRIRDRRWVVVDPDRGVALAFAFFDHAAGKTRTFELPNGRTMTAGPVTPWTWEIAEVFRVEHGLMRRIEAVYIRAPYGMNSGWSTWRDSMSTLARWNDLPARK